MAQTKVSAQWLETYQQNYGSGPSQWRWLGALDKAHNIETLCQDLSISSVVDIGAGEGSILKALSDRGFAERYYALEITPTAIAEIENRDIPGLVECSIFDGYEIPYGDKQFDLAVLSHVVEHAEHPRSLLYEAQRIAKYVFIEVPLEDNIRLSRNYVYDGLGHINFYSIKTIRRLAQTCDFTVLDHKITNKSKVVYTFRHGYMGLVTYYVKQFLLRLSPALATRLFTFHSAMVCESSEGAQDAEQSAAASS
jgi:hypothetical protein